MKKTLIILGMMTPLLYGCASNPSNDKSLEYGQQQHLNTVVLNNIYLSAQQIQDSVNTLNGVEKARYGSAALPLTFIKAMESGKVSKGDRLALLGIGSGLHSIMLGVQA